MEEAECEMSFRNKNAGTQFCWRGVTFFGGYKEKPAGKQPFRVGETPFFCPGLHSCPTPLSCGKPACGFELRVKGSVIEEEVCVEWKQRLGWIGLRKRPRRFFAQG